MHSSVIDYIDINDYGSLMGLTTWNVSSTHCNSMAR